MGFLTTLPRKDRTQLAATAAGVLAETGNPGVYVNLTAPTSQTVYGCLLGLRAGDIVTGVLLRNNVAAAGTAPTTARAGIADATGKILALTGNVGAAASWPAGAMPLAFTAPYTITADGGYYACYVVNGTWGTTQPTPLRAGNGIAYTALGASPPPLFNWTGQTDLPSLGASLTLTASGAAYYMAFY